jgi:fos-like antigen
LESEQAKLQNEIKTFQREKDELEFILEAHRLHCGAGNVGVATTSVEPVAIVKEELVAAAAPAPAAVATTSVVPGNLVFLIAPSPADSSATPATRSEKPTTQVPTIRRPTSLATVRFSAAPQIAGVAITTPSSGINIFTLGLESMIDGHTGLTPITGLPVSFAGLSTPVVAIPTSGGGPALFCDVAAGVGDDTPVVTVTTTS